MKIVYNSHGDHVRVEIMNNILYMLVIDINCVLICVLLINKLLQRVHSLYYHTLVYTQTIYRYNSVTLFFFCFFFLFAFFPALFSSFFSSTFSLSLSLSVCFPLGRFMYKMKIPMASVEIGA